MEMKMMLVMVMTMFMMVDEGGGYNDGGQPNFLPEKVKDSEARLSPPSSHASSYSLSLIEYVSLDMTDFFETFADWHFHEIFVFL